MGADFAQADDTEGFFVNFYADEAIAFPFTTFDRCVGFRDVAGHGEHHGDRVFGSRDRVTFGGVNDYNSFASGGGYVHVVYADTGAADDLE